ncbi:tyrosine-protein kinase family protein [Methylocaldum sp.]|uniref:tyrosine-protein kinase family protein n=1 Tax=Methylocaldum sp. TaxID=1969727 RepID=UPI002D4E7D2B|nr:AAA family ATPase [Methylocaldum sp.]HYE37483.1 AAA family ATPase [Methylocaldum sp.]
MNDALTLRKQLDDKFGNRYELEVGADKTAIILVIDESFSGKPWEKRLEQVESLIRGAGFSPGIMELYTSKEAEERGLSISTTETLAPANWESAVSMVEAGRQPSEKIPRRKPRRVVFYSYKGGVGRTTALVHTAFHLARNGERVVIVDMDVEAPGLHSVLPHPDEHEIQVGLVDYLWERQVRPYDPETGEGMETCLVEVGRGDRLAISYSVEDPVSRAQIHVIPAGAVGAKFVRRLATLSSQDVLSRSDDAWSLFEKELVEQIEPDVMLIDARTGLGDWGGLSLLRLADEAFLILYPSDQNAEGIRFVRETLSQLTGIKTHLVLSPVPEGVIGMELVARFLPLLGIDESKQSVEEDERPEEKQPVVIHYNPSIASALRYPVESAMADYARLANLLRDTETEGKVEATIQRLDRWKIIESLKFPERDAKAIAADDFELFFQKTSDFEKFLDDARWVVRGRKGTGKSTLFHLFVEHKENAAKRARGRLEDIDILPGHGPAPGAIFRPTTDEFEAIRRGLDKGHHDWLSFWRAYAIIRVFASAKSTLIESALSRTEMKVLRSHLNSSFPSDSTQQWRSFHTTALLSLLGDPLNGLCRDLMIDMNKILGEKGKKLWLLYDDLDQDIKEDSEWQEEALGGLLRLAYDSNNRDLHHIRFKIFLREDIWSKLVFTNKSHFGEARTLLLQWKVDDFLRLAYRLATGGSPEFRALAQRDFPLTDSEVDTANEEELRKALAPLWGLNQEKKKNAFAARWVYNRMTDARDNTYPRSLTVLLNAAREEELRGRNNKPASTKPAPMDRLLSPRAMQAGLTAASYARVNELKNEYPDLIPFLEDIEKNNTLRSQFKREELSKVWEATSRSKYPTFESFVTKLKDAGLLEEKKRGETYDYGIASLYIDGLGVRRVQGEKK